MSRGPDAGTLLLRALRRDAAACGCAVDAEIAASTRWASATFTGARHRLMLCGAAGAALDAWLAGLPEADLPLRRHLVADVAVLAVRRGGERVSAEVEALTVEN